MRRVSPLFITIPRTEPRASSLRTTASGAGMDDAVVYREDGGCTRGGVEGTYPGGVYRVHTRVVYIASLAWWV